MSVLVVILTVLVQYDDGGGGFNYCPDYLYYVIGNLGHNATMFAHLI